MPSITASPSSTSAGLATAPAACAPLPSPTHACMAGSRCHDCPPPRSGCPSQRGERCRVDVYSRCHQGPVIRDSRSVIRGPRSIIRDRRSVLRGPRSIIRDRRSVIRGPRSIIRDRRSVIRGPRSIIRDRRSVIRGPRSIIRDRRSVIRGPRSIIRDRRSARLQTRRRGHWRGGRAQRLPSQHTAP